MALDKQDLQAIGELINGLRTEMNEKFELLPDKVELWGRLDDILTHVTKVDQEQTFNTKHIRDNADKIEELDGRMQVLEGQQKLV